MTTLRPKLVRIAAGLGTALALAAAGTHLASAQGRGNPRSATVQKVFPAALRIQLVGASGKVVRSASGIAFAREGGETYVLTNAHVVDPSPAWSEPVKVRVLAAGRAKPLEARVVARGKVPEVDLAVLEVDDGALATAELAGDDGLELGDDLVVIGAPFGKGLSVAAGIVSQVEYDFPEGAGAPRIPRTLKTDAAIGYGSSGGGVFEVPSGRLVGLVEGYRTARVAFGQKDEYAFDVPMPGETFVAPAAKIRRFLSERGLAKLLLPGGPAEASARAEPKRAAPPPASGS
ncbi:S1C family serine protease [Anaeromyxobacter paludicola]|uniref:Peptidase S1 and S6 chymotrypsin/Hap n=1 Tax=Anaeromyxobacter paludicola TaxID=2918171 RepID=A0ABM7X7L2_9BACT|nr:serine protease [Anaeromyxobacter paludicola]BDG07801.1 hypothetical protein AMPC_09140 [Anaeromyxobacter paludicola]